jgi:hypothetical protein
MGKLYNLKTRKKVTNGKPLVFKDYSLKIIFECPEGHLFSEEYYSEQIMKHGMDACLKESININEKRYCPACDEVVEIGKRPRDKPEEPK